jgi:2',3'-cyclic-nucleotide 2'-phosphodiesterase (5'-nucleotidase family)
VLLDNGDTFHGTYPVVHSKGEALLPILNAIRFDAMTGHWDFAYGPPHLKALASKLCYPMLAVNCFDKDDGQLTFPPTRVVERGVLRVGIAGVAATIVDKTMPPQFSTGARLTLGVEELPDHIARLREQEGVDLVVVLSHPPVSLRYTVQTGDLDWKLVERERQNAGAHRDGEPVGRELADDLA